MRQISISCASFREDLRKVNSNVESEDLPPDMSNSGKSETLRSSPRRRFCVLKLLRTVRRGARKQPFLVRKINISQDQNIVITKFKKEESTSRIHMGIQHLRM